MISFTQKNIEKEPTLLTNIKFDDINASYLRSFMSSEASSNTIDNIFNNAIKALRFFAKPCDSKNVSKILCIGKVQSGKTSFFIAATSLAFDNGYDLVFLFGGTKNTLKDQNFDRISNNFSNNPGVRIYDINEFDETDVLNKLNHGEKVIITVLKNVNGNANLNKILSFSQKCSKHPTLIIDDEGDEYTPGAPNLKKKGIGSKTHDVVVNIINEFECITYLSITATPQANLLISTFDEISPNYISLVYPGEGYTGGNAYHDTSSNIHIKIIDDADTFEYSIPGSFREALFNFIFNCALAYSRGDENNYSMLVHPSSLKKVHNDISSKISEYINKVLNTILSDPRNFSYNSIKKSFYDEYKKYTNNYSTSLTFDEIFANLSYVLPNIKSFTYNSDTDSDEIENDAHKYKILIGGNMLGRGLTIERLIITYIYRDSKISPIDTLYQRARWFGYKQSYFDLCKVYLTYELDQKFRSIVDCENDLRSSLESFLETNINAKEFKRLFKVNNDHLILTRPSVSKTISLVRVNPGYTYDKSVNFKKDQLFNNKKLFEKYFSSHKLQGHEENFSFNNNQIHYIIPTTYTKFYEDFLSKYELPFGSKFGQLGFKNLLEQAKEGKISDKFTVIIMRYKTKQYRSMNPNKFIKELPQSYDESTRYPGDKRIKPFCNQFSIQIHLVYTDEEHPEDYIPLLALNNPLTEESIRYCTGEHIYGPN